MKNDLFPPVRAKWFRYYLNELFLATNDGDKNTFFSPARGKSSLSAWAHKNSMGYTIADSVKTHPSFFSDLTGGLSRLLFNTLSLINLFAIVWDRWGRCVCVCIFLPFLFGQINYGPKLGSGLISNSNNEQNQCRIVTNFLWPA